MAGFSGGWLREQFYVDPPEPLHQIDPAHAQPLPGDPTLGAWSGPPILATDPAPYLVGESVPFVVDTPGHVQELDEWGDHWAGYDSENHTEYFTMPWDGGAPGDIALAAASTIAHSQDLGAAGKHVYDPGPMDFHDERFGVDRIDGFGPIELPVLAGGGQRGLNSYPVNNPGLEMYGGQGYRYGVTETPWQRRRMYDPTRVNDERLVTLNDMTVAADQPVPGDPGPYNDPFPSLARIIRDVAQKPMMRRQPPPIDQSIMTDGTEDLYAADDGDWVMG